MEPETNKQAKRLIAADRKWPQETKNQDKGTCDHAMNQLLMVTTQFHTDFPLLLGKDKVLFDGIK